MQQANGYPDGAEGEGTGGDEGAEAVALDGGGDGVEVATLELIMAAGERLCETGAVKLGQLGRTADHEAHRYPILVTLTLTDHLETLTPQIPGAVSEAEVMMRHVMRRRSAVLGVDHADPLRSATALAGGHTRAAAIRLSILL